MAVEKALISSSQHCRIVSRVYHVYIKVSANGGITNSLYSAWNTVVVIGLKYTHI